MWNAYDTIAGISLVLIVLLLVPLFDNAMDKWDDFFGDD